MLDEMPLGAASQDDREKITAAWNPITQVCPHNKSPRWNSLRSLPAYGCGIPLIALNGGGFSISHSSDMDGHAPHRRLPHEELLLPRLALRAVKQHQVRLLRATAVHILSRNSPTPRSCSKVCFSVFL